MGPGTLRFPAIVTLIFRPEILMDRYPTFRFSVLFNIRNAE
jgi:hypothetical protein